MAERDARTFDLDTGASKCLMVNVTAARTKLLLGANVLAKLPPWPSTATAPVELTGSTAQNDGHVYHVTIAVGSLEVPLKATDDGTCVVLVEAFAGSTPPEIQTVSLDCPPQTPVLVPTPWGG